VNLDPDTKEQLPMALYMYQAAYTPESLAAQIKEPRDRIEAVRPAGSRRGARRRRLPGSPAPW
jgi:hypothetical protein